MRYSQYYLLLFIGCLFFGTSCTLIPNRGEQSNTEPSRDTSGLPLEADTLLLEELQSMVTGALASDSQATETQASPSQDLPSALLDSLLTELAALRAVVEDSESGSSTGLFNTQRGTDEEPAGVAVTAWKIARSILVMVFFFFLIRSMTWTLDKLSERRKSRRLFFKKLAPIFRILLWSFAVYIIIVYVFEFTGTGLVSALTALGVGIGFAVQDVLKNIIGGIIIVIDEPFQVGDKINIGGTYGEVKFIGLRSTRIETPDDNLVSVPNAQVVANQVSNANAGNLDCQVVVDLYLPGWVDATKARSIAYSAAANSRYVYLDKPIVVNVKDEFKETFLTHLVVKAYVFDCLKEMTLASDITETAKAEFLRHNMLFPLHHEINMATPQEEQKTNGNDPNVR